MMVLRLVGDFRRAMDLSLVLTAEAIPHELRQPAPDQWTLEIDESWQLRAEQALLAFERENPRTPRAPPEEVPASAGIATGLGYFLAQLAFFVWTGPESDNAWFTRGAAEAAAILRGQWFRTLTALTLHADAGHAVGNAVLGGLLLVLLSRKLGAALAALIVLLAGVGGTALTAELMRDHFTSIGASTAVFGALGALAAVQARDPASRRQAWIPLGAGVALLTFLGTGKRSDVSGHLCGFLCGALLGLLLARVPRKLPAALALLAPAALAAAWWAALAH